MNETIRKFGYPATLIREFDHWLILVRPAQVTFGSLVLAAKSDATAYSQLPSEAFTEQCDAVRLMERCLKELCAYQRINYLMLMMVDPNVHFHVIPRYEGLRHWKGVKFPDAGWPRTPDLTSAVQLSDEDSRELTAEIARRFD